MRTWFRFLALSLVLVCGAFVGACSDVSNGGDGGAGPDASDAAKEMAPEPVTDAHADTATDLSPDVAPADAPIDDRPDVAAADEASPDGGGDDDASGGDSDAGADRSPDDSEDAEGGTASCAQRAAKPSWVEVPNPLNLGGLPILSVGPRDAWFLQNGGAANFCVHWDGTSFVPLEAPSTALTGLWASGPNDVWFTGQRVLRWNGTSFTPVLEKSSDMVWGLGPNDVWILARPINTSAESLVHWNGTTFTSFTLPLADAHISAIWGGATNDVWAFGGVHCCDRQSTAMLAHWNGTDWTVSDNTTPMMKARGLFAAWGSSSQNIWVVAQNYAKASTTEGVTEMWHSDGNGWTIAKELPSYPIGSRAISGSAPDDIWMFNGYTTTSSWHYNGVDWSLDRPVSNLGWVFDISHSSADEGWAAGLTNGTVTAPVVLAHFRRPCLDAHPDGGP